MRNKLTKFLTSECPPKGMRQFAKTWKYAACMLLAFILGIGQMWGATYTYDFGTASDFPELATTATSGKITMAQTSYTLAASESGAPSRTFVIAISSVANNKSRKVTYKDASNGLNFERCGALAFSLDEPSIVTILVKSKDCQFGIDPYYGTTYTNDTYGDFGSNSTTTLTKGTEITINCDAGNYKICCQGATGGSYNIKSIKITPAAKVTFDGNGATSGTMEAAYLEKGVAANLPANAFVNTGKDFAGWKDASENTYTDEQSVTLSANLALTAQWVAAAVKYAITEGTPANGTVAANKTEAAEGATVTITATPDFRYLFDAWDVYKTDDPTTKVSVTETAGVYTFEMPAYPVTVSATFTTDSRKQILYLTTASTANDKMYAALNAIEDYNVIVEEPGSQTIANYDLVVLHESIGGTSSATAVTGCKTTTTPVLNTKSYFYGETGDATKRWGWGKPVSGKKTSGVHVNTAYCNITSHPLFNDLTPDENDSIIILSSINSANKPIQPITEFTSGKEGYTLADVPDGCAIHELTPAQRGAASGKYLLISVYNKDLDNLNANGQKLFQNAAAYLLSATTWTPVEGLSDAEIDATGNPFSEGTTMTLTASATGAAASTTYAWYKGDTWAEAEAAGVIQAAEIAENNGHIYTKTAAAEDAGTYWCVMVKSTGCGATASVDVNVVSCTKPGTPTNLTATDLAYTTATLSWDAAANADGYKISIIKKSDESVVLDWTDCATTTYAATGMTQGTEYTFKVKAVGASGYCEYGIEATIDFSTTAPSIADLVTIADDWTFTPSATIAVGTLAEDNKLFASGDNDCDYNSSGMRIKENRALAFKLNNGAKVKVTFTTNSTREMKLGTAMTGDDSKVYGHSNSSPVIFEVTADGVVYLTATSDLRFSKMEILYPHSVTYNAGEGSVKGGETMPTQASVVVGTVITLATGDALEKSGYDFAGWLCNIDGVTYAAGAEYTMTAAATTFTAQWVLHVDPVDPTLTYNNGAYSVGASALDLSSLIETQESTGAITYSVKTDGGTSAVIDGNNFTATAAGTATITASQAAVAGFNAKTVDFDVVVTAPAEKDGVKLVEADALTGNFRVAAAQFKTGGYTIDGITYANHFEMSSNVSSDAFAPDAAATKHINYTMTKKTAKFWIYTYNTYTSAYKVYAFVKEEGEDVATHSVSVESGAHLVSIDVSVDKNAEVFFATENKSKMLICQIVAVETGDALLQGGEQGYVIDLANGRLNASSATLRAIDGIEYMLSGDYKVAGTSYAKIATFGTHYVKFTLASPLEVNITTANTAAYYVGTTLDTEDDNSKLNETSPTKNVASNFSLAAGTYYISPKSSEVQISKLEFTAPKCAEPSFDALANSDICSGDPYVALDGTATTTDAGTVTYKWYAEGADESDPAAVLGTDATYTPSADGKYYVIATNSLSGYSDNVKKSDLVSVTTHASAVITTAPLNQRGLKDAEVTLSVAATGKNVAYKWYTCDEDGSNEAALYPEQTGTSIEVTITAGLLQWYKVKVTSDCGNVEAMAKVEEFVPATPANVTESIVWDWESSAWPASGQVAFTDQVEDGTDLTPAYELLADADAIVPNNAAFRSDMLYGKGQYVWRSGNKFFQGTAIKFTTEVAGRVRVYYRSTGNNKEVQVTIAGTPAGKNKTSNFQWSEYVEVPVGDVEILCLSTDANKSLTRVQKIEFQTPSYVRTEMLGNGVYGTICVDHNVPEGGIRGVTVYEIAGREPQYGKIAFDEVTEMEAGVPYVFIAHGNEMALYYGETTVANPVNGNGMYGTFVAKTLTELDGIYYFAKSALWSCVDLTSLNLPANRAYVKLSEIDYLSDPNPAPGRKRILLGVNGQNATTDLGNVQGDEVQSTKVLINGQLFILRGEKMYDATGRIVK